MHSGLDLRRNGARTSPAVCLDKWNGCCSCHLLHPETVVFLAAFFFYELSVFGGGMDVFWSTLSFDVLIVGIVGFVAAPMMLSDFKMVFKVNH